MYNLHFRRLHPEGHPNEEFSDVKRHIMIAISRRINVYVYLPTLIYLHLPKENQPNVGRYTSQMDLMGNDFYISSG